MQCGGGAENSMRFLKKLLRGLLSMIGVNAIPLGPDTLLLNNRATSVERATSPKPFLLEQHLASLLEMYRVNCVIDVGAHKGGYALSLRRSGYTGQIISFEPVSYSFERLQRRARNDRKWSVHNFALGDREHRAEIQVAQRADFSSLLTPNSAANNLFGSLTHVSRTEHIEVKRLDSLFEDLCSNIDLPRVYLKMDTQGYDLKVFEGLGSLTGSLVGLQSEVSVIPIYDGMPDMLEAMALYRSHGFELTGLFPVSRHNTSMRVVEFDCVMVRADALK